MNEQKLGKYVMFVLLSQSFTEFVDQRQKRTVYLRKLFMNEINSIKNASCPTQLNEQALSEFVCEIILNTTNFITNYCVNV